MCYVTTSQPHISACIYCKVLMYTAKGTVEILIERDVIAHILKQQQEDSNVGSLD